MRVVFAFFVNTLFNFAIGLLVAKFLGPEQFGQFALALAVGMVIQTAAFDWIRLTAIEHPDGRRVTVTLHKSSNTFPQKTLTSMFLQACWAERRSDTPEAETLVAAVLSRKKAVQPEGAYGE